MVVQVHGGPSSIVVPSWPGYNRAPCCFPRATSCCCPIRAAATGRARRSPRANVKDFGYGDLRDILAGVDAVVKKYPIDTTTGSALPAGATAAT